MKKVSQQEFIVVSPEDLKKQFPNLSDSDIAFYTGPKILDMSSTEIGIKKYNFLKDKQIAFNNYNFLNPNKEPKTLSDLEIQQIKDYESDKIIRDEDLKKNEAEYMKIVREGKKRVFETIPGIKPNVSNLYYGFLQAFSALNNKDFELNEDSILNIKAVVKFFAYDKTFLAYLIENAKFVWNEVITKLF